MKYPLILQTFMQTPLAILPEKAAEIRVFLLAKARGENIAEERILEVEAARRHGPSASRVRSCDPGDGSDLPAGERYGTSQRRHRHRGHRPVLDSAMADQECKAVVMAFDSPGGGVMGVPELAAKIRAARDNKRIIGMVDSRAASAAYWLCSQCSEVCVTPGGMCGSIGVFSVHEDCSQALAAEGTAVSLIKAGEYKFEDNPFGPLTDEARAEIQSKVDYYYGLFTSDVAKGRGVSADVVKGPRFGQGRMLTAQQAKAQGAADRIGTFADVLAGLGVSQAKKASTSAMAAKARARAVELEE